MALQKAIKTGGDFLDLKELCAESGGTVLAVFRIREFPAAEKGDFGPILPVIADVLVCSGPREGEVHAGERFIGAITGTLRGVKNPKRDEPIPAPATAPGSEIAGRLKVINEGKGNASAVLDTPSDVEYAAIEKVHADGAGWTTAQVSVPAQASNGEPVAAGTRPW